MHVTLTLIMLILTLKNTDTQAVKTSSRLSAAAKVAIIVCAICSFVLFSMTYSLSHCCAQDFVKPFGPLIKIQHTSVFTGKN